MRTIRELIKEEKKVYIFLRNKVSIPRKTEHLDRSS